MKCSMYICGLCLINCVIWSWYFIVMYLWVDLFEITLFLVFIVPCVSSTSWYSWALFLQIIFSNPPPTFSLSSLSGLCNWHVGSLDDVTQVSWALSRLFLSFFCSSTSLSVVLSSVLLLIISTSLLIFYFFHISAS